jgi:hypothetical protein
MSSIANIVSYDGAGTPASHTLVPEGIKRSDKDVLTAFWREQNAGLPFIAQVAVEATQQRLPSGIWRVGYRVMVPVMESVSGQNASGYTAAPKVAYTNTIAVLGLFHERSSVTERRLARQLALNIGGNISTSVTPQTAGFAPELFDQLVFPV